MVSTYATPAAAQAGTAPMAPSSMEFEGAGTLPQAGPLAAQGEMAEDATLAEIEALIVEMEELEKQTVEKREQKAFMNGVIAEKQQQCLSAKEQHDEKIRVLARQARKQRGRKTSFGASPGPIGGVPSGAEFPQDSCSPPASSLGAAAAAGPAASHVATLDMNILDEVLGAPVRRRLLGGGEGGKMPFSQQLSVVKQALDERLDLSRCLNQRLASLTQSSGTGQAGATQSLRAELDTLRSEVADLIEPGAA